MPEMVFTFQFWSHCFFSFLGTGLLYMQWGRSQLRVFAFSDFLDTFKMEETTRIRLELAVFLVVGTAVAMGITRPGTASQAFSAGLGWTGLAAKPSGHASRSKKGK